MLAIARCQATRLPEVICDVLGQRHIYRLYALRLRRQLAGCPEPRHVGITMDGNRRWARRPGMPDPSLGHKHGADHVQNVLNWCQKAGIRHVTCLSARPRTLPIAGTPRSRS
jgi:Putative undecaprenyl diphosphate synthase